MNTSDTAGILNSTQIADNTENSIKAAYQNIISANSKKCLAVEKNDETKLEEAVTLIMYRCFLSDDGSPLTIDFVNDSIGVKQIRYCADFDDPLGELYTFPLKGTAQYYYSIHDCDNLGRLFIFYRKNSSGELNAVKVFVYNKPLSFIDFDSLTVGKSTIKDVEKIDSQVYFSQKNLSGETSLSDKSRKDCSSFSVHMTSEGYVSLGYKEVNGVQYVAYIDCIESDLIKSINPVDLYPTK